MSYMENSSAFTGGIQELSTEEIGFVGGGVFDPEDGPPGPELGWVSTVIRLIKEVSQSKAVRNLLVAAEATDMLTRDTPVPAPRPVNGANGTGAVGGLNG